MGSGNGKREGQSVEDWLAQKLLHELDDDPTQEAPRAAPAAESLEPDATEESSEPPLPWPDWQPDPLPEFVDPGTGPGTDAGLEASEPDTREAPALQPWEHDGLRMRTVELLGEDTRPVTGAPLPIDAGPAPTDWDENTGVLLADDPPVFTGGMAEPPPLPEEPVTRELPPPMEEELDTHELQASIVAEASAPPTEATGPVGHATTRELLEAAGPQPLKPPSTFDRAPWSFIEEDDEDVHDAPTVFSPTSRRPGPKASPGWGSPEEEVGDGPTVFSSVEPPMPSMPPRGRPSPPNTPGTPVARAADLRRSTLVPESLSTSGVPSAWSDDEDVHDAPTLFTPEPVPVGGVHPGPSALAGSGLGQRNPSVGTPVPKRPVLSSLRRDTIKPPGVAATPLAPAPALSPLPPSWSTEEDVHDAPTVATDDPILAEAGPATSIDANPVLEDLDEQTSIKGVPPPVDAWKRPGPISGNPPPAPTQQLPDAPPTQAAPGFSNPDSPDAFLFGVDQSPTVVLPEDEPAPPSERGFSRALLATGISVGLILFVLMLVIVTAIALGLNGF